MNSVKSPRMIRLKIRSFRTKILYSFDKLSFYMYFLIFGKNDIAGSLISFSESTRVLLFSPHQDDETLGCGGLLLAGRNKATVQTVYVTNGKGPKSVRTEPDRVIEAKIRSNEAERVCSALQINKPIHLGFDEIKINAYDDLLIKKISDQIEHFKPTVIMTPFLTDANPEHIWLTKNIAKVESKSYKYITIIFYRVHGQIPHGFQNAYFGLTKEAHQEKENILNLFKSQLLDKKLVKSKYLLYSKMFPRYLKKKFKSIERYTITDFEKFKTLHSKYGDDVCLKKLRSINYASLSFRCYLLNEIMFKRSDFVRFGPDYI